VYRIDINSFLYNLGVRRGDLIVSVNLTTMNNVQDLVTTMDSIKPRIPIKLLLKRGIDTIDITVS
jgi:type II secretory pathway component PulC